MQVSYERTLSTAETGSDPISISQVGWDKHFKEELTGDARVVGLDVGADDLAVLGDDGVALAPDVAEHRRGVEADVERLCELTGCVGEIADLLAGVRFRQYIRRFPLKLRRTEQRVRTYPGLLGVQGLAPGLHDKGVIDGDNNDLAGIFGLWGVDVARDVRLGAGGA